MFSQSQNCEWDQQEKKLIAFFPSISPNSLLETFSHQINLCGITYTQQRNDFFVRHKKVNYRGAQFFNQSKANHFLLDFDPIISSQKFEVYNQRP